MTTAIVLASLASGLVCVSCATLAVSDKGWEEYEAYWSITQVLDARLLHEKLWLLLELKRERSNFKKLAALSLSIDEATWVRDRNGNLSCPKAVPWTKAAHVSPRASVLRDPKEFPETGQELEVQNLILNDPSELNALDTKGAPWTVALVQFKPMTPGKRTKRDTIPVLALVRASGSGSENDKCVLYTFFLGMTHNEGWVLLAPFAMAFDAVTLPIQLLALLWWFIAGD